MAKVKQVTVSVSRTVQITQFHPSTVIVSETIDLDKEDDAKLIRQGAYLRCSKSVEAYMNKEIEKYTPYTADPNNTSKKKKAKK